MYMICAFAVLSLDLYARARVSAADDLAENGLEKLNRGGTASACARCGMHVRVQLQLAGIQHFFVIVLLLIAFQFITFKNDACDAYCAR